MMTLMMTWRMTWRSTYFLALFCCLDSHRGRGTLGQGRSDYRKDDRVDLEEVSKSQRHLYPSGLMLFCEL